MKRFVAVLALIMLLAAAGAAAEEQSKLSQVLSILERRYYDAPSRDVLIQGALEGTRRELTRRELEADLSWPQLAGGKLSVAGVSADQLEKAALDGMLASLDDPYTSYLPPQAMEEFLQAMGGSSFGSVGLLVDQDERSKEIVVMDPVEGTPAHRAGIRAGDIIQSIDGEPGTALSLGNARQLLQGKPGTELELLLRRGAELHRVCLVRDAVSLPSVSHRTVPSDRRTLGYVRIRFFGSETAAEMSRALSELENAGADGYILDLRNNGGGFLSTAVEVGSFFLPPGKRVVSVTERDREPRHHLSERLPVSVSDPVAVLINGHSASASEITAAALREHGRAVLVGQTSFGKGSVQKLIQFGDGSGLKVTTAHYLTPSGKDINGLGMEPDVASFTELGSIGTPGDRQLEQARKEIASRLPDRSRGAARQAVAALWQLALDCASGRLLVPTHIVPEAEGASPQLARSGDGVGTGPDQMSRHGGRS
ncbi:MAG: S41 family peptidase [Armatimonadetes bacterium]|nr:S41 family peptidase [Armatimonadota bacterium]